MSYVNAALRAVFDVLLFPFRSLPALVGVAIVSLLTAVAMLLLFKVTSNQQRLAEVKRRIHACLFEVRLFNDDVRAIVRAFVELLRHNATYLRLAAVSMLLMLPPLVLMIAQLQFHYGYEGLEPGESFLVKARLKDDWKVRTGNPAQVRPSAHLKAPSDLAVETPGVWVPTHNELAWRVRAKRRGDHRIQLDLNGETVTKTVQVSGAIRRRSPVKVSPRFWDQLLYPAEEPLDAASAIESVAVRYPDASVSVFGLPLHWMIVYFVLSLVFAFGLRKRFGVTI